MLTKRVLAVVMFCVMVAVGATPAVIGAIGDPVVIGPPEHVERLSGLGSPRNSATVVEYTITEPGYLSFSIEWVGLRAMKIEIYDITDGGSMLISSERIRAAVASESTLVEVMAGNTYRVVAIPGGGPGKGDYALITPLFYPKIIEPPVAIMDTPTTDYLTVNVDGSASYDPDGMIVSYDWDFGDMMGTASGATASYTYSAAGTYTITLTVTDDDAATDSTTMDVTVEEPPVVVGQTLMISDMGMNYLKSTDYADLGRYTDVPGVNSWWEVREWGYGEYIVRPIDPLTPPPLVLAWPVYSVNTAPDIDAGFALSSFYRIDVDAPGLTAIGTAVGMDPIFVPQDMDATWWGGPTTPERLAMDGGVMTFDLYGTYFTETELYDLKFGTHYGNSYFGVPVRSVNVVDDGWWHELQGHITFDVASAQKYLGLAGTGDLRDEFAAANAAKDVNIEWSIDWMAETGAGDGKYDIYTAYDYSNDIRYVGLTIDPASTADSLILRLYSVSWGNEMLMTRYLEAAGVLGAWQTYNEDFSIVGDVGLNGGNITVSAIVCYHLTAGKDAMYSGPAWAMEAMHVDYCGNDKFHYGYPSPFNVYDPDQTDVTKISTLPGTLEYGNPVSYWYTPMEWDLGAGDTIIIQMPTGPFGGFTPEAGSGVIADAMSHWVDGTLAIGSGDIELGTVSGDTITLTGPINFPTKTNPAYPSLLEEGSPSFYFIVV